MKKGYSLGNRILALVMSFVLIFGMLPVHEGIAAGAGVVTTNAGSKVFVVGESMEFTVTTVANDDAGTMVIGSAVFSDPTAIQSLEYYETKDGNWYALTGDFGPATGFPMSDATSKFRVTFNKEGGFTVNISMRSVESGEVLCSTGSIPVTVKLTNDAEVTTNVGTQPFTVNKTAEFIVTTTANGDAGTMVTGTATFSDFDAIEKLEYYEVQDGNWYELAGDFGPATGFPMSDATSRFRVTFNKAGSYTVNFSMNSVETGETLCSTGDVTVTVNEWQHASVTTDAGAKNFIVDRAIEFSVTTAANDDAGLMVIGTAVFSNPEAIEKLEYYEVQDGNWYELTGDFGPGTGFPMSNATSRFRVTFKQEGNYTVNISMKEVATGNTLCSTGDVSVAVATGSAVNTDVNTVNFIAGIPAVFTVTTAANGDAGTMVIGTATFSDFDAIEKLEYYEVSDGNWYELTGDFGPATGFPMSDATSKFRVTFKQDGDYTVNFSMKDVATGNILCSTGDVTFTVNPRVAAVMDTNIDEMSFIVGTPTEFTFTTTPNDYAGTMVIGTAVFSDPSAIAKLEYYEVSDGNWYELTGDFGPATGFPLTDATSIFRVTFNKPGDYTVTAYMKEVGTDNEICSTGAVNFSVGGKPITVTVNSATKTYGDADSFTYAVTGELDANAVLNVQFDNHSLSAAGEYTLNATATVTIDGVETDYYDITVVPGTLTVNQRPITVTVGEYSKNYGQYDTPVFAASADNVIAGHAMDVVFDPMTETAAGSYTVTPASVKIMAGEADVTANYAITIVDGTYTINQITAEDFAGSYTLDPAAPNGENGWYTSDVTITASEGYKISYQNTIDGEWTDSIVYGTEGTANVNFYLRNEADGTVSPAYTEQIKLDKSIPVVTSVTCEQSAVELVFETITFGLFKAPVTIYITAEDGHSGVATISYSYEGHTGYYSTEVVSGSGTIEGSEGSFNLPANFAGTLSVTAVNTAGQESTAVAELTDKDSENWNKVLVDGMSPERTVEYSDAVTILDAASNKVTEFAEGDNVTLYYADDATVTFNIFEQNFFAEDVVVKVNDVPTSAVTWKDVDGLGNFEGTLVLSDEGEYVVTMTYTDRSGNVMNDYKSPAIVINKADPAINVTLTNENVIQTIDGREYYNVKQSAVIEIQDKYFHAANVQVTVEALDFNEKPVDGIPNYAEDSAMAEKWAKSKDKEDTYTLELPFNVDANYILTVTYTDLTGHTMTSDTLLFTVDTTAPEVPVLVTESSALEVFFNTITFGYFNADVTVKVTSSDLTAGLDYITYTYTGEEAEYSDVNVEEKDDVAVVDGEATFTVPAEFLGTLSVTATDKSHNTSEAQTKLRDSADPSNELDGIVIDTIDPDRSVGFSKYIRAVDNATLKDVETFAEGDDVTLYYNGDATVTFNVTEQNFFAEDTHVFINGVETDDVKWEAVDELGNFKGTLVLSGEGDYVVTMSYEDKSDNEMIDYVSPKIVIDTNAPKIDLECVNTAVVQNINGRDFLDKAQFIKVTIEEHNFRADDVNVIVHAKDFEGNAVLKLNADEKVEAYYEQGKTRGEWSPYDGVDGKWRREDDTFILELEFEADANYDLQIKYADLAANGAESEILEFTVDTTAPTTPVMTTEKSALAVVAEAVTFGFFEAPVIVNVTSSDATSGVDYITYTYEGTEAKYSDVVVEKKEVLDGGEVSFTIPAEFYGTLSAYATDNSRNDSAEQNTLKDNNGTGNSLTGVVIDTIAPTRTVEFSAPTRTVKNTDLTDVIDFQEGDDVILYYDGDATVTFKVTEQNFFAEDVVVKVNGVKTSDVTWKDVDGLGNFEGTLVLSGEGDYKVTMEYVDKSDNEMVVYKSPAIVIDTTAPVIKLEYVNTVVAQNIDDRDYFDKDQTVKVTITERNFRADEVEVLVHAVDVLGEAVLTLGENGNVEAYAQQGANRSSWSEYQAGTWRREGDAFVLELTFDTDANYDLQVKYTDLVYRKAESETWLFTVDKTAPANLTITYSESIFHEIIEDITFGYYNAPVTVVVTADDDTTVINQFVYSYILNDGVASVNAELLDQKIQEAYIEQSGKTGTASFTIPKGELDDAHQFNGTVAFSAFDRSKNESELNHETNRVTIVDNIAPERGVSFSAPQRIVDNADHTDKQAFEEGDNVTLYYSVDATVTFNITEHNFDPEDVVIIVNDERVTETTVAWECNPETGVNIGTLVLADEGTYEITMEYTDKSTNEMNAYASPVIIVDKTNPTMRVTYQTPVQQLGDIEYYDATITGNIEITELNFRSTDVRVHVEKDGEDYPVHVNWNGSTGTFTMSDDGDYNVTVDYADLATNNAQPEVSNTLVLDTGLPTIVVTGINHKTAYNTDAVGFTVTVTDDNIDAEDIETVLTSVVKVGMDPSMYTYETKPVKLEAVGENGVYEVKVNNLEEDGYYILTCTATDNANHVVSSISVNDANAQAISVNAVHFSVNREGSTFYVETEHTDKYTGETFVDQLNDAYANDQVKIVVREINVDKVNESENDEWRTIFTLNDGTTAQDIELTEGDNYTKNEQIQGAAAGWYENIYTLDNAVFDNDGVYSFNIITYDQASNSNVNTKSDSGIISFVLDRTNPVVSANIASGQQIDAEQFAVEFKITDANLALDTVTVLVDGEEVVPEELGNNEYTFAIGEGLNHTVEINASDKAGNSAEAYQVTRFTVSTNFFVRWYANPLYFYGSLGGVGGAGLLLILLLLKKKKKEQ